MSDQIKVLPLSPFDDRLRIQVARAIYRDPVLSRYGLQAVGSIHIIVDNGHVTLTGVVSTEMEKNVAGIRANGAGLSFGTVTNNLQVDNLGFAAPCYPVRRRFHRCRCLQSRRHPTS
jgi:hyperosmotically inducible protein